MPITYPLVHPATPGFRSIRLSPQNAVAVTESPYSFATQVQTHQGQRWIADVTLPPIKQDSTADDWAAFLTALRGRYGTFLLGDSSRKTPRGTVPTESISPFVYGASQSGNTLVTRGWSVSSKNLIRAGDYIQLGGSNLLLRSQELNNAAWSLNDVVISSNVATAPDGTSTADGISVSGSDGVVFQNALVAPGCIYTFSIWLRAPAGSLAVSISIHDGAGYEGSTSAVLTSTWKRYSYTTKALSSYISVNIGRTSSLPDGAGIYAWGAQLNEGVSADPYIPTTSETLSKTRRLHKVISDCMSDSNGEIALNIFPRLRVSPSDFDYVKTANCVGTFRMAEEPSWDVDEAKLYGISFRAVEDI